MPTEWEHNGGKMMRAGNAKNVLNFPLPFFHLQDAVLKEKKLHMRLVRTSPSTCLFLTNPINTTAKKTTAKVPASLWAFNSRSQILGITTPPIFQNNYSVHNQNDSKPDSAVACVRQFLTIKNKKLCEKTDLLK